MKLYLVTRTDRNVDGAYNEMIAAVLLAEDQADARTVFEREQRRRGELPAHQLDVKYLAVASYGLAADMPYGIVLTDVFEG